MVLAIVKKEIPVKTGKNIYFMVEDREIHNNVTTEPSTWDYFSACNQHTLIFYKLYANSYPTESFSIFLQWFVNTFKIKCWLGFRTWILIIYLQFTSGGLKSCKNV